MAEFSINDTNFLTGKQVTLCLTGSVACIRAPELARTLLRNGAEVYPIMTKSAQKLLGPDLMEWACENPVVTELTGAIEHVELGAYTDLVIVFPATANTISKIACGIDDTTVTSTVSCALGAGVPVIVVPAMHLSMYKHKAIKENLKKLKKMNVQIIPPRTEEGKAKVAWNQDVIECVIEQLTEKDLKNKKIVVTGGPTYEKIDDCRGIMNRSSGKMACAIATRAAARGARVTLVYGPGRENPPMNIKLIPVTSAKEMTENALKALSKADCLISVAAIADYSPKPFKGKLNSEKNIDIKLKKNKKLVREAKKKHPRKLIVGFKLEEKITEKDTIETLKNTKLDLIVANTMNAINAEKAEVIISDRKHAFRLTASKQAIAEELLDVIKEKLE